MKNKLLVALCVVLLFIPTYIAITFYVAAQSEPVSKGVVYKMTVTDLDGTSFIFNSDDKTDDALTNKMEADPISFFIDMNNAAEAISELPAPLVGGESYTVIYYSYNLQTTYKYYFSDSTTDAYYTDNKGNAFRITAADASSFISSQYAVSLYKGAATPIMTLGNSTVLPKSMTWYYKLSNNQYSTAVVPLAQTDDAYNIQGSLQLSFDVQPDYLYVTIMQGENRIYNDVYANLSQVSFTESATLTVGVTAKWNENEERGSYGEATYNFLASVKAPAEFYLGEPSITLGEFVVITGKNVDDLSKISFASEPDIGFTPVFFEDKDGYVTALVPLSYDLEYSPSYKFSIDYEGRVSELTLNCTYKEYGVSKNDISKEIIATTRDQSAIKNFNTAIEQPLANQLATRYWIPESEFALPLPKENGKVKRGFGRYIELVNGDTKYRNAGVDFSASEGTQVFATCAGEVAYVGTLAYSGRTIIIDHGFGLKSIYCHLSSFLVEDVGTTVDLGTPIGVVGSTGFAKADTANLYFALYVFNVPVNPYELWGWEGENGVAGNGILVSRP